MLVATVERPAGFEVKRVIGQVFGVVVRSRSLIGNVAAGLRSGSAARAQEVYAELTDLFYKHAR